MQPPASRKIVHIDMDAFYASVEARDNPALRGRPVVVGGAPDSRGVVAAASYEARRFGIRSAMACARAYRLCPQAVFIPPNFEKYRAVSRHIHEIFHRYTDQVEGLSLDEAYLDVTRNRIGSPSATRIAQAIRREIQAETGLTASAGVAANKFLAKVACEVKKPNGLFVIRPEDVPAFLPTLPVAKVPGIGEVTRRELAELGVTTCGDLQRLSLADLARRFGKRGEFFFRMARGLDDRPVVPHRAAKSFAVEDTFAQDHDEPEWLQAKLAELAQRLSQRLAAAGTQGRTVTLKLRLTDFSSFTRARTLRLPTAEAERLTEVAAELFDASGLAGEKLRLLGLGVSQLDRAPAPPPGARQLTLWDAPAPAAAQAR
jgi:DNA polymerase-4